MYNKKKRQSIIISGISGFTAVVRFRRIEKGYRLKA